MTHRAISPKIGDESAGPLIVDKTSPKGLKLHLLPGASRLATPWQVALDRSQRLAGLKLPEGEILDPACGSGIQLAAHMISLSRVGFGVEIDSSVANSAAANLWRAGTFGCSDEPEWLKASKVIIGDGTDSRAVMQQIGEKEIGLLQLDPARPQNSRTHSIEEMSPTLESVFESWKGYLNHTSSGPALLLDLSPRLSSEQCVEIEKLVMKFWPDIEYTWEWTSRGSGRIDRLSLWVGAASTPNKRYRFVRIPPKGEQKSIVIEADSRINSEEREEEVISKGRFAKRGDYITILDSALVSSGLAEIWLGHTLPNEEKFHWIESSGRRPIIIHSSPLKNLSLEERLLMQATGKIVAMTALPLELENVGLLADIAKENRLSSLTIRTSMNPETHPQMQGLLHKKVGIRGKSGSGFIVSDPMSTQQLICKE